MRGGAGSGRTRAWLVLCCLVVVGGLSPAAFATPSQTPSSSSVWIAQRVSAAPSVVLDARFGFGHVPGAAAFASLRRAGSRLEPMDGFVVDTPGTSGGHVYTDGRDTGCPPGSACDVLAGPGATDFIVNYPKDALQPDVIYLAVRGEDIKVTLVDSPGWQVRRTALKAKFVASTATSTGAESLGQTVEHFETASTTGNASGSIAIGSPPCRPAHRVGVVREGTGTAQLTGGTRPAGFDCRTNVLDAVAATTHDTVWELRGNVTGIATGDTRLTVIQRAKAF